MSVYTACDVIMLSAQVNGFEVYDTEEAILYFLEQDPEIVLSVARPIRKVILVKERLCIAIVLLCNECCYKIRVAYKPGGWLWEGEL